MDEMSEIIDHLSFFMENDCLSVEDTRREIKKILRGSVIASHSLSVSAAEATAETAFPTVGWEKADEVVLS